MTLTQMEYIIALDQIRHFRRAAMHLGISQPSLSNQLSNLEEELGAQLFERSTRQIKPTAVGEKVIAQAHIILGETRRLELIVKGMAGEMAGELRIGIIPTLTPYLLPLAISGFADQYPDVKVTVQELVGKQMLEYIKRDLIDVGIVSTEVNAREIEGQVLYEEPLVCYVSPTHALASYEEIDPAQLNVDDLWLLKEGHALRDQTLGLCPVKKGKRVSKPSMRYESDSLDVLKRMVEGGKGMVVLPRLAATGIGLCDPSLIRPFKAPAPYRTIRMVYARRLLQTHLLQALAQEIVTSVSPVNNYDK